VTQVRRALARLYDACGFAAGLFMVAIFVTIVIQIFGPIVGYIFRVGDELSGYFMAASFFLALAHTFGRGEHIRVGLILERLTGRARRGLEIWSLAAGSLFAALFGFYSARMCWVSYQLNDVSTGLVPFKLWIPQLGMAIGGTVFAIAMIEQLLVALAGGAIVESKTRE